MLTYSARFVGEGLGFTPPPPLWCLSTPKFSPKFSYWPSTGSVKNNQKYIDDPLWFYHKSSSELLYSLYIENIWV